MTETHYEANGFYEPNWFHMYLSNFEKTDLDFKKCTDVQLGLYVHEYTHYLQNIITISGIRNAIDYYRFLHEIRTKLSTLNTIELPVLPSNILKDKTLAKKEKLEILKGSSFLYETEFDRFDSGICSKEINGTKVTVLKLNFYKGSNSIGHIDYGNLCVKEGMSTALQSLYDSNLNQPFYPYKVTQLLVDQYCPIISNKPVYIAVLCSLALNFENSGFHFFRLLVEFKQLPNEISFENFIESELNDKKIEVDGKIAHSLNDLFLASLKELKQVLNGFLNSNLIYIRDLFHNLEVIELNHQLKIYEIFNSTQLSNIEKLELLKENYGIPLIQFKDGTLSFPSAETESGIAEELIELMSLKTIAERLFEINGKKSCRFLPFCEQNSDFETDDNCFEKQWKRTEYCPFIQVAKYWNINDKLPQ
jgi:hypothetical protein